MNPARILVVDDEPSARKTVMALLNKEPYEVATAAGGEEALAGLEQSRPDVVLLDVMMPDVDGFEVCRRLKAMPEWSHVPVVLITALDSKEDLARGLESGADDFLTKPVNGLELRARVRSMLRMKRQHDELRSLGQLRDDLVHMIAHDMRSPLSIIVAYCDLALRKDPPAALLGPLDKIRAAGVRLDAFVSDLLLAAKLESGKLVLGREDRSLDELVREVEASHKVQAESRGVALVVDCPEVARVNVDPHLFQRVLDNLVSNAIKFSPRQATVTLALRVEAERVRVRVSDEGSGVPEDQRDKLFEKFGVVTARMAGVSQVGLGLAFCKLVAEAHGGGISFEPNEPRGSVFTVEL